MTIWLWLGFLNQLPHALQNNSTHRLLWWPPQLHYGPPYLRLTWSFHFSVNLYIWLHFLAIRITVHQLLHSIQQVMYTPHYGFCISLVWHLLPPNCFCCFFLLFFFSNCCSTFFSCSWYFSCCACLSVSLSSCLSFSGLVCVMSYCLRLSDREKQTVQLKHFFCCVRGFLKKKTCHYTHTHTHT